MDEADLNIYRCLNKHKVRYLLIGGMAAILYGSPRLTKDTDIFIESTLENCQRLIKALKEVHFGTAGLTTAQEILKNEVSIFKDYTRLDVLTKVKGIDFQEAWAKRVVKRIEGVRLSLVSLGDLIAAKKAAARTIDKEDVRTLEKVVKIKRNRAKSQQPK